MLCLTKHCYAVCLYRSVSFMLRVIYKPFAPSAVMLNAVMLSVVALPLQSNFFIVVTSYCNKLECLSLCHFRPTLIFAGQIGSLPNSKAIHSPAYPANIRLGSNWLAVTNTLAYYGIVFISTTKSFIVQTLGRKMFIRLALLMQFWEPSWNSLSILLITRSDLSSTTHWVLS